MANPGPENKPGLTGHTLLDLERDIIAIDERVTAVEGGGGGGLSQIQFSIGWSGGDADFKTTVEFDTQQFILSPSILTPGLQGIVMACEVHTTEAWAGIGTAVGLLLNVSRVTPSGAWLSYDPTPPGAAPERVSLHTLGVQRGFLVNDGNGLSEPRSFFGATPLGAEYDPNAQFTSNMGPSLSNATAGKTVVTLHYIPIPTAVG